MKFNVKTDDLHKVKTELLVNTPSTAQICRQ